MNFPQSIYIHLPFCLKKCHYCIFQVHFLGHSPTSSLFPSYLNRLADEISHTLNNYPKSSDKLPLDTLFFGGGTPSLFSSKELFPIFELIKKHYKINEMTEISFEMNPGTFSKQSLSEYLSLGINRFSLGVQSFNEEMLKTLNRGHNLSQVIESIEILKNMQSDKKFTVSWDLLTNLPYETDHKKQIFEFLSYINKFQPEHLSIYSMILEPESVFYQKFGFREEVFPMPNQDFCADQLEIIHNEIIKAGYHHYEISSFAKETRFFCRHNELYWEGNRSFFGFGMGATSLINGKRISRPKNLKKYMEYVENLRLGKEKESKGLLIEEEKGKENVKIVLMGGLRREKGVDLKRFGIEIRQFLTDFSENYKDLVEIGADGWMKMKGIKGFLLCDEILARIFVEIDRKALKF